MKITAAVLELMALPYWVVDPQGNFTGGYPTQADAQDACQEMNDYAKEDWWRVIDQPELVTL